MEFARNVCVLRTIKFVDSEKKRGKKNFYFFSPCPPHSRKKLQKNQKNAEKRLTRWTTHAIIIYCIIIAYSALMEESNCFTHL